MRRVMRRGWWRRGVLSARAGARPVHACAAGALVDRVDGARLTLVAMTLVVGVAVGLAASPVTARAHTFEEKRRVVLSVERDAVEVLVAYELRGGKQAETLRAMWDVDGDGQARTKWEELARGRVLLPRIRHGVVLELDGRRVRLPLVDAHFEDLPERGRVPGIGAVVRFRVEARATRAALRFLEVRGTVLVEAQLAPDQHLADTNLPRRPGDPVLGPHRAHPGDTLFVGTGNTPVTIGN